MQPFKWVQIGKILISFATFCFIFPHALNDYGRENDAQQEPKAESAQVL